MNILAKECEGDFFFAKVLNAYEHITCSVQGLPDFGIRLRLESVRSNEKLKLNTELKEWLAEKHQSDRKLYTNKGELIAKVVSSLTNAKAVEAKKSATATDVGAL